MARREIRRGRVPGRAGPLQGHHHPGNRGEELLAHPWCLRRCRRAGRRWRGLPRAHDRDPQRARPPQHRGQRPDDRHPKIMGGLEMREVSIQMVSLTNQLKLHAPEPNRKEDNA